MRTPCSYAACRARAQATVDGWDLCGRHVYEHRLIVAEDVARGRALADAAGHYSGRLMPSRTLAAVLTVLDPEPVEVAS